MMKIRNLVAAMTAGGACLALSPLASAQVSVNLNLGPAPACPYGYFDYAPYACAPPGYYGPEWFAGGVFLGAGPWFHGPRDFHGHVDNRFDPNHGYHGALPARGERAEPARQVSNRNFHGNEDRDGRGHTR